MVLVCDSEISDRALELREKILKLGCPCAVSRISEISDYLPLKLIITFYDRFDDVRRTPYDAIFVIALGRGFVNSALNAVNAVDEDCLIEEMRKYLYKDAGITQKRRFAFGVVDPKNNIFFSKYFLELYGKRFCLTASEYMIFKYLTAFAGTGKYFPPEKVAEFCYDNRKLGQELVSNKISVHINHINDKIKKSNGTPFIRAKRFRGYYADIAK